MELKSLAVGLIIGLVFGSILLVAAANVTPQGNLDFRGDGGIIDAKNISIQSPDTTLWTCTVTDAGVFECAE